MAKTYTTQQGDTWDTVSYRNYGTENHTAALFFANTEYKDVAIFGAGVVLSIPIIETEIVTQLPPWLRPENQIEATNISELPPYLDFYENVFSYRWADRFADRIYQCTKLGFSK